MDVHTYLCPGTSVLERLRLIECLPLLRLSGYLTRVSN
jgi:hypothetical protein